MQVHSHKLPLDALKWKQEVSGTTEAQTFYLTTNQGLIVIIQVIFQYIEQ